MLLAPAMGKRKLSSDLWHIPKDKAVRLLQVKKCSIAQAARVAITFNGQDVPESDGLFEQELKRLQNAATAVSQQYKRNFVETLEVGGLCHQH